jgi:hypothetical protein
MLRKDEKIGIICSKASNFEEDLLQKIGIDPSMPLCVRGMEDKENFVKAAHEEIGILDPELIEKEVVSRPRQHIQKCCLGFFMCKFNFI